MKIFVASAMEKQHTEGRLVLGALYTMLLARYGEGSTFLAAVKFPTPDTFISPRESFDLIIPILNQSHAFVFYYPRKVFSGALVELGYALAWGKPTLVLTESAENLPYMFQGGADMMTIETIPVDHADAADLFSRMSAFLDRWSIRPAR